MYALYVYVMEEFEMSLNHEVFSIDLYSAGTKKFRSTIYPILTVHALQ